MGLPPALVSPPAHADLVRDLETWRSKGVLRLRKLVLPALRRATIASGHAETAAQAAEPAVLTDLVRQSLSTISGSVSGRCAVVLLGLDPDTFDLAPNLLREDAAEIYGVSWERFRREPQRAVLEVVADRILEQCFAHQARLARLALERRHPADTRLAVHWLERFEAYFRIWTPVYALGADLTAYRATLLEQDRPWDRVSAAGELYTQQMQAAGYGTSALYHLACALDAEQQFLVRHGGLWLLSSPEAETNARDALHTIQQSTSTNERDHSWLRVTMEDSGREMHRFLSQLQEDRVGMSTHDEWQEWLSDCNCAWDNANHDPSVEYFPTSRYHPGIKPGCLVHQTIEAANRFCATIEQEWIKVADWYSIFNT
jgi:hypothetical protein